MRHILSVLVDNKPGVLTRVAGMFSRRGYNIDSIAVGTERDPNFSRMTIVVQGDDTIVEQIEKQLNKLIDVVKLTDLTDANHVEREMILIRVAANATTRPEIMQMAELFRARIVDVAKDSVMIEVTGTEGKLDSFMELLNRFSIQELARTGKIALARGLSRSNL